jgi:Fic family protein
MKTEEIEFLQQSNFIEGVTDGDSLDQAVYAWEYCKDQKELTVPVILKTHKILMSHQKLCPNEKGYFRKVDVSVGGRIAIPYYAVPIQITEWVNRIKFIDDFPYKKKDLETMSRSLHVQYESIHPFVDGNGRTGRIFMNWWRLKKKLPILVIKEEEKFDYYTWFI